MYDIDALEQSWKRYRRKRLLAYGVGAVLVLAAGAGLLYFLKDRITLTAYDENRSRPKVGEHRDRTGASKGPGQSVAANVPVRSGGVLAPTVPSLTPSDSPVRERPKHDAESKEEMLSSSSPAESAEPKKPKMTIIVSDRQGHTLSSGGSGTPAVKLKVTEAQNRQVVRQIEKRFRVTRDYDDAIYLAKHYYRKHQYKKAEYWAMQANTIDSTQEESWMLFGKAKAKRGMRADALKVLQAYYDRTGSMRVKDLIDRIRKGKSY